MITLVNQQDDGIQNKIEGIKTIDSPILMHQVKYLVGSELPRFDYLYP